MPKIVCDESKCSACMACVVACIDQHSETLGPGAMSCRIYEKKKSEKSDWTRYITRSCLHCTDAPCVHVCPVGALYTDERGFVISLRDKCIGCHACARACPHDVPRFDNENKIVKCDGCSTRAAMGLEPACVSTCNTGALKLER